MQFCIVFIGGISIYQFHRTTGIWDKISMKHLGANQYQINAIKHVRNHALGNVDGDFSCDSSTCARSLRILVTKRSQVINQREATIC